VLINSEVQHLLVLLFDGTQFGAPPKGDAVPIQENRFYAPIPRLASFIESGRFSQSSNLPYGRYGHTVAEERRTAYCVRGSFAPSRTGRFAAASAEIGTGHGGHGTSLKEVWLSTGFPEDWSAPCSARAEACLV
jgi:hypothetical protein